MFMTKNRKGVKASALLKSVTACLRKYMSLITFETLPRKRAAMASASKVWTRYLWADVTPATEEKPTFTNANMVRLLPILLALFFNLSCASDSGRSPLTSFSKADSADPIIVVKVVVTPVIDYAGRIPKDLKDMDNPLWARPSFTSCATEKRSVENLWDEKCDFETKMGEVDKFYAIKADPTKTFSWLTVVFGIYNDNSTLSIWFGDSHGYAQGQFTSWVRGFYIKAKEPLEAGKVYYAGTIKFHLDDKSFAETGDEEYNMEQALYVVPMDITIEDEFLEAKEWLNKSLKYNGPVQKLSLNLEFNDMESKYRRIYRTR